MKTYDFYVEDFQMACRPLHDSKAPRKAEAVASKRCKAMSIRHRFSSIHGMYSIQRIYCHVQILIVVANYVGIFVVKSYGS